MMDYISGWSAEFIVYPLSVVIKNMQTKYESPISPTSKTFSDCVKALWKAEGIRFE